MTCKHVKGDPDCTGTIGGPAWQEQQDYYDKQRAASRTPEQVAADKRAEAAKIREEADRLYAAAGKLDGRAIVPPELAMPASPKPDDYEVEEVERVGPHLVLRVRYPSCAACSYEGAKVLVILDTTLVQAMKWRRIDPHFRDPSKTRDPRESPSPAARFPASAEGWADALAYARSKVEQKTAEPVPFKRPRPHLEHSHGEEPCEACARDFSRSPASGCRFSPQRANGAADQ